MMLEWCWWSMSGHDFQSFTRETKNQRVNPRGRSTSFMMSNRKHRANTLCMGIHDVVFSSIHGWIIHTFYENIIHCKLSPHSHTFIIYYMATYLDINTWYKRSQKLLATYYLGWGDFTIYHFFLCLTAAISTSWKHVAGSDHRNAIQVQQSNTWKQHQPATNMLTKKVLSGND